MTKVVKLMISPSHGTCLASKPGDTMTITFVGTYVGVFALAGPSNGNFVLTIDGNKTWTMMIYDSFCYFR
jgi:hypothetical protein